MSSAPESVECPECGESFDPTDQGGYCTNPDCGEYRWESDQVEETSGATEATGSAQSAEPAESESGLEASGAEAASNREQEFEEETIECPSCGNTVPHMRYCKSCGEELLEEKPEEAGQEPATPTCPNCGEEVEEDWAACPFCETSLRGESGQDTEPRPAATASAETEADTGSTAVVEGAEEANVDTSSAEDDEVKVEAEADADETTTPDAVVIEVGNTDIEAGDGDTVGRKVRSAHVRSGGSDQEAQYIHREHVRFEREGDEFYLINEGRNGTKLNGEELTLDERRAVSDGDEIEFSNVVSGTLHLKTNGNRQGRDSE